jgi:Protein of unknown function (DUF2911)
MYKKILVALTAIATLWAVLPAAQAQSALLDLPRDSQHAQITQKIGVTNITINYHRPLVKGRKVFGGLEPYGKVWRAGANENTTIRVSDAVTVEGKPLPAGTYGLHMIPGENEWTVIFSKTATAWGSFTYDQKEDALRVTVKPSASDFHEALTYDFDDPKPNVATVTMRWDKVAVPFKVEVNTDQVVAESLEKQLRGRSQYEWQAWDEAATYLLDHKLNPEEALKDAKQSIQVEERFENLITEARVLEILNRKDEATTIRNKALATGTAIQVHIYGRTLQQQGKQDQAFDVFRANIKKYPDNWLTHAEMARLAVAKGDFDTAVKEMRIAAAGANDQNKAGIEAQVKRLENKEDINR